MPEYLAPGVYVEEVPRRPRSIEGVSTMTTGFVGPTRCGPTDLVPGLITSLAEFERIYGDGRPLEFGDTGPIPNFTWQAVRAYFEEGGRRLYVVRVFRQGDGDGRAHAYLPVNEESRASDPGTVAIRARYPGSAGAMRLRLTVRLGEDVFGSPDGKLTPGAVRPGDIVWISERARPAAARAYRVEEYVGAERDAASYRFSNLAAPRTGLKALEDIDEISIVAAPGSAYLSPASAAYESQVDGNINLLVAHAERMRYRIAVLDATNALSLQDVREQRAKIDSKYAAFYYPWVRIVDPITGREADMPPSGFVAGIYARNDITRGVHKAPASEVVNLAIGFEQTLNDAQQDVLNPEGINCFRFFAGRGYRLWGARTASSDPEWK